MQVLVTDGMVVANTKLEASAPMKTKSMGKPILSRARTVPQQAEFDGEPEERFWQAAQLGEYKAMEDILKGIHDPKQVLSIVTWLPPADWEPLGSTNHVFQYKNRPVRGQAIHVAAALKPFDKKDKSHDDADRKSRAIHLKETMDLLLKKRADPAAKAYSQDNTREYEPIHFASGADNIEALRLLVKARADVQAYSRCLPPSSKNLLKDFLDQVEEGNILEAIKKMEEIPDHKGKSFKPQYLPIHDATWFGRVESVKWLIDHKADCNAKNDMDFTPLHIAARLGDKSVADALLSRGADLNILGKDPFIPGAVAESPLMTALRQGKKEVAGLLLAEVTRTGVEPDMLSTIIRKEGSGWADALDSIFVEPDELFHGFCKSSHTREVDWFEWSGEAQMDSNLIAVPIEMPTNMKEYFFHRGKDKLRKTLESAQQPGCNFVKATVCVFPADVTAAQDDSTNNYCFTKLLDTKVIRAIATTENEEMMTTTFVEAVTNLAFETGPEKWSNYGDVAMHLAGLIAAAVAVSNVYWDPQQAALRSITLIVLLLTVAKRFVDEAWQLGERLIKKDAWTGRWISWRGTIEWIGVIIGIIGWIYLVIWNGYLGQYGPLPEQDAIGAFFVALFCFQKWMLWLYSLRGFEHIGPRFLPILYAVYDTGIFAFVVLTVVLGATHAYFVIGPRDIPATIRDGPGADIYASFFRVFNMGILNVWDPSANEGADLAASQNYVLIQIFHFCMSLGINIVLMQLSIGVLGGNFGRYTDRRHALFIRERANMILDFRERPGYKFMDLFYRNRNAIRTKELHLAQPKPKTDKRFLWVMKRSEHSAVDSSGQLPDYEGFRDLIEDVMDIKLEQLAAKISSAQEPAVFGNSGGNRSLHGEDTPLATQNVMDAGTVFQPSMFSKH